MQQCTFVALTCISFLASNSVLAIGFQLNKKKEITSALQIWRKFTSTICAKSSQQANVLDLPENQKYFCFSFAEVYVALCKQLSIRDYLWLCDLCRLLSFMYKYPVCP